MIMNMPVDKDVFNLAWNIGSKLYRKEEHFITLPEKAAWCETIELNGVLHVFIRVYGTSTQKHYKYENGEFVYICDLPSDVIVANNNTHSPFVVYKGAIYAGLYKTFSSSSASVQLAKFNNDTQQWQTISLGSGVASKNTLHTKVCVYNDLLVVTDVRAVNSYTYMYLYTWDGSTLSTQTFGTQPCISGSYVDSYVRDIEMCGDFLIISMSGGTLMVDMTSTSKSLMNIDGTAATVFLKKIKGVIYPINSSITRKLDENSLLMSRYEILKKVYNLFEYKNKMLYFNLNDTEYLNIFEVLLYKEATAYVPKGSKIYLPDNAFAMSDNLKVVNDYYLVTESGEVKIGLYE